MNHFEDYISHRALRVYVLAIETLDLATTRGGASPSVVVNTHTWDSGIPVLYSSRTISHATLLFRSQYTLQTPVERFRAPDGVLEG